MSIEEIKERLKRRYILPCSNVDEFYDLHIADPKVRTEYAPNLNKAMEDIQTLIDLLKIKNKEIERLKEETKMFKDKLYKIGPIDCA